MSYLSVTPPAKRNPNVIRDPFTTPPHILNRDEVCFSVTVLQLIMASPSLMVLLYEHNYCSLYTCNVLDFNIPQQSNAPMNWIDNIEYAYIIHEVMTMMGFQSNKDEKKGIACCSHTASTGCQNILPIHQFPDIQNDPINGLLKENVVYSNQCKSSEQLEFNDNEDRKGIWNYLKRCFCKTVEAINYELYGIEPLIQEYRTVNKLRIFFGSILMLFLNFLFHGEGGVNENEIRLHIFHDTEYADEVEEKKYKNIFPLPPAITYSQVSYYPHLKLMSITISYNMNERLKKIGNFTMEEFPSLWHQPWDDDIFLVAEQWMSNKTQQFIIAYSLPSTVIIDHEEIYYYGRDPIAVKISPRTIDSLAEYVEKMIYHGIKLTLPNSFWCDDLPCKRKMFKYCLDTEEKSEAYELFAIIFTKTFQNYYLELEQENFDVRTLDFKMKFSLAPEETAWQLSNTSEGLLNKLRTIIKPILKRQKENDEIV
ncbi:hypothetical protein SNEBB_005239 [Seison nebaliae]|nr:hypothetical protein SNEBB_005239 [Seison nebaliae]